MNSQVIVIGSANQDYVIACEALPRAGETRLAQSLRRLPGGKGANQAVAVARLGAPVTFVGAVGDDDDGALLIRELRSEGVDTSEIEITTTATGMAVVSVLPSGDNAITVVPGANFTLTPERSARAVRRLADETSVVVVQAEIPVATLAAVIRAAAEQRTRPVINLAPFVELDPDVLALADPLVVNEVEAAALTGYAIADPETALRAAQDLAGRMVSAVITLGASGACWANDAGSGHVGTPPVDEVVDSTGAGDAFIGGLVRQLSAGGDLESAVRVGVEVGTAAVTRLGAQASYPRASDIKQLSGRQPARDHAPSR